MCVFACTHEEIEYITVFKFLKNKITVFFMTKKTHLLCTVCERERGMLPGKVVCGLRQLPGVVPPVCGCVWQGAHVHEA